MNDDARYEHLFADALTGTAPSRAPMRLRADISTSTSRMRPRPRWLALIKESPMRHSSRTVVGSPTARIAAIVAATLLLAVLASGAVLAGTSLLAGSGPIVVAQDGSGTYTTISEALAAAADGDTILIRPGTYPEAIVVDKSITIRGDGNRDDVIIEVMPDGPTSSAGGYGSAPFGIQLLETDATLANLSVIGPDVATALVVTGGKPIIEGLRLELAGQFTGRPRNAFVFERGAMGTMKDVTTDGFAYVRGGSSPTIERLHHTEEGFLITDAGSDPQISDSTMSPDIQSGAQPTIRGSLVVGTTIQNTGSPVFRGNTFANPDYEFGDFFDSSAEDVAVDIISSSPVFEDNRIGDHPIGIRIAGGSPTIKGNAIEHNEVGLMVSRSDEGMTFGGNMFCGNGSDLEVPEGSTISLDGNDVCPSAAP